jgi:excisionase family DNA binding protein
VITTSEAAAALGVSVDRVQALIRAGRLPATRFGKAYVINEKDLALVKDRKPGRPKKGNTPGLTSRERPQKASSKKRTSKKR